MENSIKIEVMKQRIIAVLERLAKEYFSKNNTPKDKEKEVLARISRELGSMMLVLEDDDGQYVDIDEDDGKTLEDSNVRMGSTI